MRAKNACFLVGTLLAGLALLVGSAAGVTRHPAFGKPGAVQLVPVQGGFIESDNPSIVFPKHTIQRSSLAPRSLQRVCTSFQVTQAPSPPATTWPIVYTSGQYCTWLRPGFYALLGDHPWTDAKTQVEYHVSFVVSWSTKTKKKLARATYDFDTVNDYKCLTTICHVGQAADSTTYIVFDL